MTWVGSSKGSNILLQICFQVRYTGVQIKKRCLISLIREMPVKTTMRHPTRIHQYGYQKKNMTSVDEGVEKLDPLCSVGGKGKQYRCSGNQFIASSKIKIELYCDPAVPLLGIYPPQFHAESHRNICILEFIAAVFTIAKIKEPNHPFAHEWVN